MFLLFQSSQHSCLIKHMPHFICLSRLSHFVWLTNNKEAIYMDWNLLVLAPLSRVFWIAPSNVPSNGIVIVFMYFPVNYEVLSCQGPVLWGTPSFNPELILKCFSHPLFKRYEKMRRDKMQMSTISTLIIFIIKYLLIFVLYPKQ